MIEEEDETFPDDALSNHTDMVDNEPVVNETRRQFIRYFSPMWIIDIDAFMPYLHFNEFIMTQPALLGKKSGRESWSQL